MVTMFFPSFLTLGGTFTADYSHCTASDSFRKLNQFIDLSFVKDLEDHNRVCLLLEIIANHLDSTTGDNIAADLSPSWFIGINWFAGPTN